MTFVKEPTLFPYCFVLTLFSFDHLFPVRSTGQNRPSVISVLWVNVASMISHFCSFSNYWTKMGISCSPICQKESCQSFLMRILFSLLSWLLSLEWLCTVPNKQHNTANHIDWGLHYMCVVHLYFHRGSKSCRDRTQLKYGMYSMHDAYITPLWPYSGKTDYLYRCGFGPSFFWRKVVVNLGPYPTNHLRLSRAAKRTLKRCEDLPGGHAQGWISCCLNVILPKSLYV